METLPVGNTLCLFHPEITSPGGFRAALSPSANVCAVHIPAVDPRCLFAGGGGLGSGFGVRFLHAEDWE